jgi:hypothetical protein
MRVRSIVLPVALAVAAAVAVPAQANAAVECGLLMPTKVVVNDDTVDIDMALTSGCSTNQASYANWDLVHPGSGAVVDNDFSAQDVADSADGTYWALPWPDVAPMGKWISQPTGAERADRTPLTQNTAVTLIKYGSKLTTKVTRTGSKLTWSTTATQWSGRSHKNVVRPGVSVGLFHKATGSTTWKYVTSVKTSRTGKATLSLTTPKSGSYRLKAAETPTVWASYSSAVRGRI